MTLLLKNRYIYNIEKETLLKYSELVSPVHNKGGAPIMHPEGPHDGQDQGQAGREEAQHLIR